eukprot:scaffold840_cov265-Pinguiococcus_pyrenoidosus.AAC.6
MLLGRPNTILLLLEKPSARTACAGSWPEPPPLNTATEVYLRTLKSFRTTLCVPSIRRTSGRSLFLVSRLSCDGDLCTEAHEKRRAAALSVIHGARGTPIDEHKTSQLCHVCHTELGDVRVPKRRFLDAEADKYVGRPQRSQRPGLESREVHETLHAIKRCPTCEISGNGEGRGISCNYRHRDRNAAASLVAVNLSLAKSRRRPMACRRARLG